MRTLGLIVLTAMAAIVAAPARGAPIGGQPLTASGPFQSDPRNAGAPVDDLSGVACEPPAAAGGARRCLFVSDENGFAQFAKLAGDTITPGATVPLAKGDKPQGPQPKNPNRPVGGCKDDPDADELDGEGVAFADGAYYVVGSHGCSRSKGKWRLSQMQIYRLPAGGGKVERSWRLAAVLANAPTAISEAYGRKLDAEFDGLTIEGLAVAAGQVWIGLRAPVVGGEAFLLRVPEKALFADKVKNAAAMAPAEVIRLKLGAGPGERMGVRDLAALGPNRLLVLAGPAQDAPVRYQVFEVDLGAPCRAGLLAELAPVAGSEGQAKAEGLAVLSATPGAIQLLVTYDKAAQGAPRRYTVNTGPLSPALCRR